MAETRDVVAVGASAGGVEALRALVAGLLPDFPAAVLVVLHIPRGAPSVLSEILTRTGPLPAETAADGDRLLPGRIYVAPADHHLLVAGQRIHLAGDPPENGHRPAIDPLFRSVAREHGRRGVGVVLSGTLDDGTAGLADIVGHGGVAVIQEPADALFPDMPTAALDRAPTCHVAPAARLGALLMTLTCQDLRDRATPPASAPAEACPAAGEPSRSHDGAERRAVVTRLPGEKS